MKVIFNHYVKIIVTFTIGPGPARPRPRPGKVRSRPGPQPAKLLLTSPSPARAATRPGLHVSGPHPARPANYYRNLTRPGPWAAGRPGPRAEARPVQDTNLHHQMKWTAACKETEPVANWSGCLTLTSQAELDLQISWSDNPSCFVTV